MTKVQVRYIGKPWPNHSAHSGYHQLAAYLGSEVPMPDISAFRGTWLPGRVAVKLAGRSGVAHYDYRAFYHEWAAAREMVRLRQRTVYHVLYGDQFFRYLGRMRLGRRPRVVATFHMPPARLAESFETVEHLSTLDALIVVGSNQVPFFRRAVDESRIHVISHGINTDVFRPGKGADRASRGIKRCLFVGMHERDFETLEAVIEIIEESDVAVAFDVVTAPERQAAFAGRKQVTFYSGVSEEKLIELYQGADVLMQPLVDCTANNAILEGLACGVPILVSDVGAARDYLNNECAEFVAAGDARQMARALVALLEDDGRRQAMAGQARQQAMRFAWDKIADELMTVYQVLYDQEDAAGSL
jgi:glycosyltransferase involved in cell wall biosynthesis